MSPDEAEAYGMIDGICRRPPRVTARPSFSNGHPA
jgi:hypothetical protein